MSETLFPYYERELLFIRQLLQEFAGRYPGAAGRLLLEPHRSADPQVERLIESFAFLAGRVQHKVDDEFPEITTPLLQALCPHFLAPIPSLGVVQFDLDAGRAQLPNGFVLPAGSPMHTEAVDGLPCRYRTAYPVTLWPLQITSAIFQTPPFPRGLTPPANARAALRIQIECLAGMTFPALSLDRLRLHLHGDLQMVPLLYELLFNHAIAVAYRPVAPEANPAPFTLPPHECLAPVGFEPDERLLPHALPARLSYRLLTEFFVFPPKFWFLDLKGWDQIRRRGWQRKCEVVIYFDRTSLALEKSIDAGVFRLGCTPVVNLFPQTAELIQVKPAQYEYRVMPDAAHPRGMEVYEVQAVTSSSPADNVRQEYPPFFSVEHPRSEGRQYYWHASREASLAENDQGSFVSLHLVDQDFDPAVPSVAALEVQTICTNRDLSNQLRAAGEAVAFDLEAAAPLARIRCLRPLTPTLRPPARRGRVWRLVSHLSLNDLSLTDGESSLQAFKQILALYDFSDPDAGQQQMGDVTRQYLEGIVGLKGRRVTGRVQCAGRAIFSRGVEVTLELDEEKYQGVGVYLFAAVLERFLGLYVSRHSFTQLAARTTQAPSVFKKWPPRPGEQPSL